MSLGNKNSTYTNISKALIPAILFQRKVVPDLDKALNIINSQLNLKVGKPRFGLLLLREVPWGTMKKKWGGLISDHSKEAALWSECQPGASRDRSVGLEHEIKSCLFTCLLCEQWVFSHLSCLYLSFRIFTVGEACVLNDLKCFPGPGFCHRST